MHLYVDIEAGQGRAGQGAVQHSGFPEVLIIANGGWTKSSVQTVGIWYLCESVLKTCIQQHAAQMCACVQEKTTKQKDINDFNHYKVVSVLIYGL